MTKHPNWKLKLINEKENAIDLKIHYYYGCFHQSAVRTIFAKCNSPDLNILQNK